MSNLNLNSPAWLLRGLTDSTAGVLSLRNERLSFVEDADKIVFDAPVGEVGDIKFPWHLFGNGLTLQVAPTNIALRLRVQATRIPKAAWAMSPRVAWNVESGKPRWAEANSCPCLAHKFADKFGVRYSANGLCCMNQKTPDFHV